MFELNGKMRGLKLRSKDGCADRVGAASSSKSKMVMTLIFLRESRSGFGSEFKKYMSPDNIGSRKPER